DDGKFVEIARIAGSGNSSSIKNYHYYDKNPLPGNNYYQLTQIDTDGKITKLGVKSLNFDFEPLIFSVYPNPTANEVNLVFAPDEYYEVELWSLNGSILQRIAIPKSSSSLQILLSNYPSAGYLLKLKGTHGI